MLDTDICIYLLTDRVPEKREHILARQPEEPLLLSAVTVSELSYGVEKSKWRKANAASEAAASRVDPAIVIHEVGNHRERC